MVSLRLITTGLEDVHSVIGYELGSKRPPLMDAHKTNLLIQPPEETEYSYEAMHDINGISIPKLRENGLDRRESLQNLMDDIDNEFILVWYKPFVFKFITMVSNEISYYLEPDTQWIDLFQLAKQKGLNPPSFKLVDVYEYTDTDNLFDLYDYLNTLPEPTRRSRV